MYIKLKNKFLYFDKYKIKCAIGKRGITSKKAEGDYKTPSGLFHFSSIFYRKDRIRKIKSSLTKIAINKKLKYFIQVNLGKEKQKSGIGIEHVDDFYYYCTKELKINIIGLMAIPPIDGNENIHFKNLMELNKSLNLKDLSIGMSGDFQEALKHETTFVRIGSSIFGNRV